LAGFPFEAPHGDTLPWVRIGTPKVESKRDATPETPENKDFSDPAALFPHS
jgi:hypothetical protein